MNSSKNWVDNEYALNMYGAYSFYVPTSDGEYKACSKVSKGISYSMEMIFEDTKENYIT